jgi:hypothetical protein
VFCTFATRQVGRKRSAGDRFHRGLSRDVINDVTDGRRHIGGIFFAPHGTFLLMEITLEIGRK